MQSNPLVLVLTFRKLILAGLVLHGGYALYFGAWKTRGFVVLFGSQEAQLRLETKAVGGAYSWSRNASRPCDRVQPGWLKSEAVMTEDTGMAGFGKAHPNRLPAVALERGMIPTKRRSHRSHLESAWLLLVGFAVFTHT